MFHAPERVVAVEYEDFGRPHASEGIGRV
jgi:hypothetical protein